MLTSAQEEEVRQARRIVDDRYDYFRDADPTGMTGRLLRW